ncbi:hypothetical protein MEO93_27705 [Dolichospermum sp. ST_sed3]|nr:hypothetical protein [Dolichospermum sp. ST_sed3]
MAERLKEVEAAFDAEVGVLARAKHRELEFVHDFAEILKSAEKFDYVILPGLGSYLKEDGRRRIL